VTQICFRGIWAGPPARRAARAPQVHPSLGRMTLGWRRCQGKTDRWLLAPIRNSQPPRRQERQAEMAHSEKTDDTSEDPISAASRFSLVRSEHRILGDLGVMAVQSFSRIRVSCNGGGYAWMIAATPRAGSIDARPPPAPFSPLIVRPYPPPPPAHRGAGWLATWTEARQSW